MEEASEVLGQDLNRSEIETNMLEYRQQCSLLSTSTFDDLSILSIPGTQMTPVLIGKGLVLEG